MTIVDIIGMAFLVVCCTVIIIDVIAIHADRIITEIRKLKDK